MPSPTLKKRKARQIENASDRKRNAMERLMPTPKTAIDRLRNDYIAERQEKLKGVIEHHEAVVRELYHLEVNQTMLDYKPRVQTADERLQKFLLNHNLWDLVDERALIQTRSNGRVNTRRSQHERRNSLVELLQCVLRPDPSSEQPISNIGQPVPQPVTIVRISSGTGCRRLHRQYNTLSDYLSTFVSLEDNDDATHEDAKDLVEKEIAVRKRLSALNKRGGFSTKLQAVANRRPQIEPSRFETHHDILISQVVSSAKLFRNNSKYLRNGARKCAKAIDRYWDAIRTQDERVKREETKRMAKLARWTAQQVKKKWKVVERICEARYKELQKEEQAKKGRRHLELILEHSEHVLGVRMEELAARKLASGEQTATEDEKDTEEDDEEVVEHFSEDEEDHIIYTDHESSDDEELQALDDDQNLSIEELRKKYMHLSEFPAPSSEASVQSMDEGTSENQIMSQEDPEGEEDNEYTQLSDEEKDIALIRDSESEDDATELNALAQEADLSVEELLQRYNYQLESENSDADDELESDEDVSTVGIKRMIEEEEENQDGSAPMVVQDDVSSFGAKRRKTNEDKQLTESDNVGAEKWPVTPPNTNMDDQTKEKDDDDRTITDYGSSPAEEDNDDDEEEDNVEEVSKTMKGTSDTPKRVEEQSKPLAPSSLKQSVQPTGTTLSTTNVETKIPFLLRGTLREYQHVGLDWLASLYSNGLNGILADEMGLGKTIQTISLLAYLACEKGIWGPHLIVVPTSVILNWEMEFKKWLPGFKILTYYGNPKERKEKRLGWSKDNAFHVCVTSYQLVLQDQNVFRRKAWRYLVLDEAHHIKNFRSQRWQVLLNFNSERRLLLTGTPLQNNLMELWSLLYFLMPNGVSQTMPIGFANLKEFQEWFSHPVDRMIEGRQDLDDEARTAIQKLHTVLRPYLLRRLKIDVEKQLPEKHEHIVYCRLSKRQRFLYDDFMSRAKTKETLASANFLSIINCLMQLRKVCNHPDLFEERPIITSYAMGNNVLQVAKDIKNLVQQRLYSQRGMIESQLDLQFFGFLLAENESLLSATLADEYDRLDATVHFKIEIEKHRMCVASAKSRGIVSPRFHSLKQYATYRQMKSHLRAAQRWESMLAINTMRCIGRPVYGTGLINKCRTMVSVRDNVFFPIRHDPQAYLDRAHVIRELVKSHKDRVDANEDLIKLYCFVTPAVTVPTPLEPEIPTDATLDVLYPIRSRLAIAFPDKRLLQYDCGKLQKLAILLRELAAGGHRALIFTQMTRVLDVLETFLNMHGYRYLRLDGATKVEQRQVLTEQFNNDKRILCFILSTRSGGLGINLTGADTVIFYDSDWNPSMDKQCQDRTHRIGQTRDVHIYRFVTEFTIEENIFKKANQKRMLDNVVIQEGEFTNDYFNKMDWWRDLPEVTGSRTAGNEQPIPNMDMEQALLEAEGDERDATAAMAARREMSMDEHEFDDTTPRWRESYPVPGSSVNATPSPRPRSASATPGLASGPEDERPFKRGVTDVDGDDGQVIGPTIQSEKGTEASTPAIDDEEDDDHDQDAAMQLSVGHVDQYMLRFWEREMFGRYLGFGGLPPPSPPPLPHEPQP